MEIERHPTMESGPDGVFRGDASVARIAGHRGPSRAVVSLVHFNPGARTVWHSHPRGQTLFVVDGVGLVQARGEAVSLIQAGDVVYAPPDEEHWHGASATTTMNQLSITDRVGDEAGSLTGSLRPVSDAEYSAEPAQ